MVTVKTSTFAGQLLHFAQSVDIVDDRTFEGVRQLVYSYVKDELGAQYFELLQEQSSGDGHKQTRLKTFWSSSSKDHFWLVPDSGTSPSNPVLLAWEAGCPLWLVSVDKGSVDSAEK